MKEKRFAEKPGNSIGQPIRLLLGYSFGYCHGYLVLKLFGIFSEYEFEVLVSTSLVEYAGTDAKVFIKLFGTQQESDEIELEDKSLNNFETGRYKLFTLFCFKVVKVKKM